MTRRWSAQELLDLVLDEDSFESWDEPIDISDASPAYRAELEAAREKAGTDESVLTGRGLVRGRPVAVVVNEFRFLAGSIGLAAARRIISAVRRATAEELPAMVDAVLAVLVDPPSEPRLRRRAGELDPDRDAWEAIEETRGEERIGVRDVLRRGTEVLLPLSGTEKGERDHTVLVVLARMDGEPCLVVGQDRSRQGPAKPMGPGALRTARRAMRLANEMGLPLVTVIDTPGAELSQRAEEGAIAGEIARCLASLATMTVPTVSVALGQGCGGGALALLPAKRVIAAEKAWLMPLPPEGASVIVHGHPGHADEQARRMRVRAVDLLAHGTAHHVVPEPDGDTGDELAEAMAAEIANAIRGLRGGG
jgi:acetyl-CoA carboxylase carboxyl transferase subunit beta